MDDIIGSLDALKGTDPDVFEAIRAEEQRQKEKLLLIASENFASPAVLAAPATSPIRSASSAWTRRPVSISSCERDAPINRGSSQLVPMSQFETPMLMNAARNTADSLA